jgi:phosphatidylserine/phosphatidylglycerophosphate/cardiolipin synthase-like enzyme
LTAAALAIRLQEMKKFIGWIAIVCIGVVVIVLVKIEVSDQLDRQYYEEHVATHMLPIDEKPQSMAARALVDQDEVFGQGLELIRGAKKQVMFGMYLFGGDIGDQVIDLLLEKQKEGVKVFMLLSKTSQD